MTDNREPHAQKFDPRTADDATALRIIAKAYGLSGDRAREALEIMRGGEGDVRWTRGGED